MFLDQMTEHNQVKGDFSTAFKLKNNTNPFQGWSKTVRLHQSKPGSILVLVLFNLNTIMVLFGSLTPPGFICDPVQLCRRRNYRESRYLSLGNQRSAGLWPKETCSVGPPWQPPPPCGRCKNADPWGRRAHQVPIDVNVNPFTSNILSSPGVSMQQWQGVQPGKLLPQPSPRPLALPQLSSEEEALQSGCNVLPRQPLQ